MKANPASLARQSCVVFLFAALAACGGGGGAGTEQAPSTPTSAPAPAPTPSPVSQPAPAPDPAAAPVPDSSPAPAPAPVDSTPTPTTEVTPPPSTDTGAPSKPAKVAVARKANYGHYFAASYLDTPADVAMLCEQAGVTGVVYRRAWKQVEPAAGTYDFSAFDAVLDAIAASHNPQCQLWLFVEFKTFAGNAVLNPCPVYLQAAHSAPNASGSGAATCFMWEPVVRDAYARMMRAAAAKYDGNPRVEGLVLQESALGFNGAYSQDVADGGTYTAMAWRDALISLIQSCGESFANSRCMAFVNFLRNGQQYLYDISAAITAVPDNRACLSGPDLLPDEKSLYDNDSSIYEVLARHVGCRANSAQNNSFAVPQCGLDCIFQFAVRGTFGDFAQATPRESGVCINSYIFWNHRLGRSATGLNWLDALPVIAAYPYGPAWYEQCSGGGGPP